MTNEWLFHICRNGLRLPLGIYLRKIHFENVHNFTKDVPVLIACNHPNSFLDGVIFEHISGRRVYTLARGDAFLKPVANYMLRSMRILPIFRATDADSKIARKGNAETMDELYERFSLKHCILIFTEGIAYPEKALRRLKKGTGNIALEMLKRSDYTMDLHVVPTALNYTAFGKQMQTVHVSYGEPIRLLDYVDLLKEDEKAFTDMVTEKVQVKFESDVVITKGDHTEEKEFVHDLMVNENYRPLTHKYLGPWKLSIEKANSMDETLANKVKSYQAVLENHKVLDSNVGGRSFDFISTLVAIFTFGISFPIYLVWSLLLPGIKAFVESKFKGIVFRDSVKIGFGMIAGMLLTLCVFITLSFWFSGFLLLLAGVLGIYGAICWFRVKESLPHLRNELRWYSLADDVRHDLEKLRADILAAIT
jgi:1-acyl-sn-glycerol-3-phosphate acyltransferase